MGYGTRPVRKLGEELVVAQWRSWDVYLEMIASVATMEEK
jgi:hypothetical protein